MKIDIDIPDELIEEGRAIHIMAGMERVAYWLPFEKKWNIKISRCSACGLCCKKISCEYLNEQNLCSLGPERPFVCCIATPRTIPSCTEKYREV